MLLINRTRRRGNLIMYDELESSHKKGYDELESSHKKGYDELESIISKIEFQLFLM